MWDVNRRVLFCHSPHFECEPLPFRTLVVALNPQNSITSYASSTDNHRRRSGWNSEGDAWRSPKVCRCRIGVEYGEGCPLSSRLGGLGSVVSSPSGVRGRAPAENGFWRILKATERSFLYLYDKNLMGTICTSVPLLQILEWGLVLRVPPWSTPMPTIPCTERELFPS